MSRPGTGTPRLRRHLAVAVLAVVGTLVPAGQAAAYQRGGGQARPAGQAQPVTIPEMAFLQPEDLGGVTGFPADGFAVHLQPPMPCGPDRYASAARVRAEGSMAFDIPTAEFHTVLVEHIATYRGSGADRYLRELRSALAQPGGCVDASGRWAALNSGVAGAGLLVLRLSRQSEDPDGNPFTHDTYLAIARVDRAVVVLADIGWEMSSGHDSTVRGLIDTALARADATRAGT